MVVALPSPFLSARRSPLPPRLLLPPLLLLPLRLRLLLPLL